MSKKDELEKLEDQMREFCTDPDAHVEKTSPEYLEEQRRLTEERRKLPNYGKY